MKTSEEYRADYTVKQVADELHQQLQRYLEAQYHARDTGVIEERRALLEETGTISQEPYLETTPSYKMAPPYSDLALPPIIKNTLSELSEWNPSIGVFKQPYMHQAQALGAFFNSNKDLIVATGTGSGKTEIFLYAILGQLLREAAERPTSFQRHGFRALILYPMNALVSDQVSRLRRLFGDERLANIFAERYGRFPRFGMYTSRTPYPGQRTSVKDAKNMRPMLRYYLNLESDQSDSEAASSNELLVRELKTRGKWPAKDLEGFFGQDGGRWENRLRTQSGDRELLMRHEMQTQCPDIIVTNYSMLEYMLLRPIERSIFKQTSEWLQSDARNSLVFVLDEAHMYRGVGGAEVAFLIRRLQSRLGIPRDRMRCILTSASLGSGEEVEKSVQEFAAGLTGRSSNKNTSFHLVKGQYEVLENARQGTTKEAEQFASFDLASFFNRAEAHESAEIAVRDLAIKLSWESPPPQLFNETDSDVSARELPLRKYLYDCLKEFGPLQRLIDSTKGQAIPLAELAELVFPNIADAGTATETLLALGAYAFNGERVLMPTRVHLFFRGLPPLYACLNPCCDQRRYRPGEKLLLGRLYTEPRTHCTCEMRARVYELYGHRDCGASFLRVFTRSEDRAFYWHEQGGNLESVGTPLAEDFLLVSPPHERILHREKDAVVEPVYLDMKTGRVAFVQTDSNQRLLYRAVWKEESKQTRKGNRNKTNVKQENEESESDGKSKLRMCPACTKTSVGKIMGFATVGEQPFANLVREQLMLQPAVKRVNADSPNGGRKVLLFSDGRQKAARLARDLPRAVEFDSFRTAIILAADRLLGAGREAKLDNILYVAFVSVCYDFSLPFFDQEDQAQKKLLDDIRRFREFYSGDLPDALNDSWDVHPPLRYQKALLRQLSDPYYSLYSACAAAVKPSKIALKRLSNSLASLPQAFRDMYLEPISIAWIQELLENAAFDPGFNTEMRREIREYFKPIVPGAPYKHIEGVLKTSAMTEDQIKSLRERLYDVLTERDGEGHPYLLPSQLSLAIALEHTWKQCLDCGLTHYTDLIGCCPSCESKRLEDRPTDHPYMVSRKGYFLAPIREVLAGRARPIHITAEEHTAQLSQRDSAEVYATTEEYELRFQDVPLKDSELKITKPPIDVLSCTTTMEVGIDIGSLTAIGLRNVPPQRENYQQRAGRSGRRGSSVSSVITYSQGGPHDSYYYQNPKSIISGLPREPKVKIDNRRIARRHINSFLIQTFFHQQLDLLSREELQNIENGRSNLMSAFGFASDFFAHNENNPFSFDAFEEWVQKEIQKREPQTLETIVSWLPNEICLKIEPDELLIEKRQFASDTGSKFIEDLRNLASDYAKSKNEEISKAEPNQSTENQATESEIDENSADLMINILFDHDLLPSYAFPTNLCTFYVFEREKDRIFIKERPQQGMDKALSEYAPGRLLVINKQTYRVGGIFVEGTGSSSPAKVLFEEPLNRYTYCPQCTFVSLDHSGRYGTLCPICGTQLQESEFLKPTGFSPEKGKALSERERDQEISYATYAQFPAPVDPENFNWHLGAGTQIQFAYGENQRLVIVNKGPAGRGFRVCESCGAAWPEIDAPTGSQHPRPFLIEDYILRRERQTYHCNGPLHEDSIYLGFTFSTDLLLLRIAVRSPLDYSPTAPWFRDALQTSCEALALAATRRLDIDPGELSAGYRLKAPMDKNDPGSKGIVDIYLYDTAAGGAGYAAEAGESLSKILDDAVLLLQNCPAHCERSCTKCLRHYGNRFLHDRLDRRLAEQFLIYAKTGVAPTIPNAIEQARQLAPLQRFLELEGWESSQTAKIKNNQIPLLVVPKTKRPSATRYAVVTYPSLLDEDADEFEHPLQFLDSEYGVEIIKLRDYVVDRDLPTAYQQLIKEI